MNLTVYGQQWEWVKSINHPPYNQFKILQCSNSGFYLTGDFNNSISIDGITLYNSGTSYFLGRFDTNGHCIWLKKTFRSLDQCTDASGNIYMTGYFTGQLILDNYTLSTSYNAAGAIAKYSSSGNLLNLKKFDGVGSCKIKVNSLNQLIVCAGYRDSAKYEGSLFKDSTGILLKLDAGLDLLQSTQTCVFSYVVQIELEINDSIYMVCNKDNPCMFCVDCKILKYSPDLTLLIDHFYTSGVGSHYYEDPVITSHSDGNIYLIQPHTYAENSAMKFSSQLNIIWNKQLYWRGSLISKNNKLFAVGRTGQMECFDSIISSAIIIELDTTLSCLWNKALPVDNILTGPGPFFANSFIDVSNNVFVTGFTDRQTVFDSCTINPSNILSAYIAKLNYSGIFTSITRNNADTKFSIFPNPSFGVFTCSFNKKVGGAKICVYDLLGNCVLDEVSITGSSHEIDLRNEPKGIYFLEIMSNEKSVKKKIILQ